VQALSHDNFFHKFLMLQICIMRARCGTCIAKNGTVRLKMLHGETYMPQSGDPRRKVEELLSIQGSRTKW
jgi:D-alanyl-D-alanine carboxypeptidase